MQKKTPKHLECFLHKVTVYPKIYEETGIIWDPLERQYCLFKWLKKVRGSNRIQNNNTGSNLYFSANQM